MGPVGRATGGGRGSEGPNPPRTRGLMGQSHPNTTFLNFGANNYFLVATRSKCVLEDSKKYNSRIFLWFFSSRIFWNVFWSIQNCFYNRFRTMCIFWDQKINLATFKGRGGKGVCTVFSREYPGFPYMKFFMVNTLFCSDTLFRSCSLLRSCSEFNSQADCSRKVLTSVSELGLKKLEIIHKFNFFLLELLFR